MIKFSDQDIKQIEQHGLTLDAVNQQIEHFKSGFPFADITRPATIGDGIFEYDENTINEFIKIYDDTHDNYTITKFVPASGAATRMFRDLFEFMSTGELNPTTTSVINNIDRFAFYDDLKQFLPPTPTAQDIVSGMLGTDKLNLGNLPKALIKFHKYKNESRTAAAEHLIEGTQYATTRDTVHIHFTLSPEHVEKFNNLMDEILPKYSKTYNVKFHITTSTQSPSTDTIAVNFDNIPFRDNNGKLVFRPSGHGALIENLNKIDSDIIFIKNIDNITNDEHRADTIRYKKLLAGILIKTKNQIKKFITDLQNNTYDETNLQDFITHQLCIPLPQNPTRDALLKILNRPVRICGMVKNTGAPGGGPFWVRDARGEHPQITESSQIAPSAREIMNQSTHFNPVDLVCSTRDIDGKKFDLTKFIDENTGFISEKSYNGRDLRAMERPGLWNGAMAGWITIFVSVPNTTFTPVKKVSDLLDAAHRG